MATDREIKFRAWDGNTSLGYKENGYQMRKVPYHPNANKRGYVAEHRLIIENKLGRYLVPRKELVHHINEIRNDNREVNLKLSNPSDHAKGHIGTRNENGTFVCLSKEFQEIKFRLFDKDRGLVQIYTLNELVSKTFRKGKFEFRGRYTGLKDKNGKEIYEGDIIELQGGGDRNARGSVLFEHGCFCFKADWIKEGKNYPELKYYTIFHELESDKAFKDCLLTEIIGNIYENPELIQK